MVRVRIRIRIILHQLSVQVHDSILMVASLVECMRVWLGSGSELGIWCAQLAARHQICVCVCVCVCVCSFRPVNLTPNPIVTLLPNPNYCSIITNPNPKPNLDLSSNPNQILQRFSQILQRNFKMLFRHAMSRARSRMIRAVQTTRIGMIVVEQTARRRRMMIVGVTIIDFNLIVVQIVTVMRPILQMTVMLSSKPDCLLIIFNFIYVTSLYIF